jgi:hypothetical protein
MLLSGSVSRGFDDREPAREPLYERLRHADIREIEERRIHTEVIRGTMDRELPRGGRERCLPTRHFARLVSKWVASIGLNPSFYGTHSLRRTKATLIYRRTGSCSWATPRLKALSVISGLRSMTLSPSRNKSTSDLEGQSGLALPLFIRRSRANSRHSVALRL